MHMDLIKLIKSLISINFVTAIAPIVAALVAVIGVKNTLKDNAKTRRTDVITQNRIKWMQEFKEYISEYIALCKYLLKNTIEEDQIKEYYLKIQYSYSKLIIHLNFKGEQDKEILNIMNDINQDIFYAAGCSELKMEDSKSSESPQPKIDFKANMYDIHIYKLVGEGIQLLSLLTQVYLKSEWERIKEEASDGNKTFDQIYSGIVNEEETKKKIQELKLEFKKTQDYIKRKKGDS